MSEELAEVAEEVVEPVEQVEASAEETTEAVETTETAGEESADPKGYTKAINKKHYELMEERRTVEKLRAEMDELRSSIPQETRPTIPDIPDPYEDDFDAKMAARDKAVQDSAAFDAGQRIQRDSEQAAIAQSQEQQRVELQKREQVFSERAVTSGISENEVTTSVQTVAAYGGVGNDLANYMLESEQGPAIISHLAKNPDQIIALQGMTPMQGAVYVNSVLVPKLVPASSAPAPVDSLGGGGRPPSKPGFKGAVYK